MRCELCMRAEVSIKANITKYYKHYEELPAPHGFNRVKMMKIYYDDDDKVACMSYFQTIQNRWQRKHYLRAASFSDY